MLIKKFRKNFIYNLLGFKHERQFYTSKQFKPIICAKYCLALKARLLEIRQKCPILLQP